MIDWRTLPSRWKKLPDGSSGVYFFVEGDTVAYIGRSKCLRKRIRVHAYTKTEMRAGRWRVYFHLCPLDESIFLERECILHYRPSLNVAHKPKDRGTVISPLGIEPPSCVVIPPAKDRGSNLSQVLRAWRFENELDLENAALGTGLTAEEYRAAEEQGIDGLSARGVVKLLKYLFGVRAAAA